MLLFSVQVKVPLCVSESDSLARVYTDLNLMRAQQTRYSRTHTNTKEAHLIVCTSVITGFSTQRVLR